MSARRALSLLAFALWLGASRVHAQAAEQDIESIREMVLYARYGEAIEAARRFLERDDLSARDRNAGLETLAIAQLANRDRAADETLRILYSRDPHHRLSDPGASPTVVGTFQRAREAAPVAVRPELIHDPPVLARRQAPVVEVRLGRDADAVDEVRIAYRHAGDEAFASVVMNVDDSAIARARLPAAEGDQAYRVEYHVESRAPSGAVLARLGSAEEPLAIEVPAAAELSPRVPILPAGGEAPPEDEGGGLLSRWWFWTVVGVVVAGGVVAGILLTQGADDAPQGTLGTFRLGD